jgi:thiol-disulfide isomerase/thioredoxin
MKLLTCIALAIVCCLQTEFVQAATKVTITGEKAQTADGTNDEASLKPVELTSHNFGSHIGDGNVWLIEFYSPHCTHCVEFAHTYEEISSFYHSSTVHKIKVGKVNGDEERALTSRFSIYAYPSFYIVDGFQVYAFDKTRTKKVMMLFAEGGYMKEDPIPFYSSPMGPMGLMQGALISAGVALAGVFSWSQNTFGFSPMVTGGIMFGSLFIGCFFMIVFLAIVVTPKAKTD